MSSIVIESELMVRFGGSATELSATDAWLGVMILIWVRISGLVRLVARNSASEVPISPAANNHRFGHVKLLDRGCGCPRGAWRGHRY